MIYFLECQKWQKCQNNDILMLNNQKAEGLIVNIAKFARQHLVMGVMHDKCVSLLVNFFCFS